MVRYGILGFGLHAVKRLIPGFASARNSTVTALSKRDLQKARQTAAEYNIPHAFDSADELCASPHVDAIFVTTPNSLHLADVLTAIRHRKPVLCEKPMALNAAQARQMVESAHAAGVLLGIAQCFRFEDSVNRFRARISAGDIGMPVSARSEFHFWGVGHARQWMNDAAISGGGPIADVGVHCIDGLRYILSDEVTRVGAVAHRDENSGEVEASALLALEFARGTLATVSVSVRAQYRTPLEIVGTEGTLRAADAFNVERPITIELLNDGKVVDSEQVSNTATYARQVDAFSDAVEKRGAFAIPGEEGLRNQLVLDAAYRSIRSGKIEPVG
jgi:predicted dehydrogenase